MMTRKHKQPGTSRLFAEGKMLRMENLYSRQKRKSIPAVLLIFDRGFDALPAIMPNGGNEEMDDRIVEWVRERLLIRSQQKTAA